MDISLLKYYRKARCMALSRLDSDWSITDAENMVNTKVNIMISITNRNE